MEPNKVGNFILKLRKDNNLTQQELADMFGITYQAVSKWENGKSIPDLLILKEICNKFNVDINEILGGDKITTKRKVIVPILVTSLILIIIGITIFYNMNNNSDFEFKTLSSECSNFNIFGSIAFNENRSHIYISRIEYCGGNDDTKYSKIECILYESDDNTDTRIDSYLKEDPNGITLEDFLRDLSFHIDDHDAICKDFINSRLHLQIYATTSEGKVITYKIPLNSSNYCAID